MEKYLIKKSANANTTTQPQGAITSNNSSGSSNASRPAAKHNSAVPELVDLNKLPRDPAKRKRMADYHPNQRDEIRRKYLIWGPNQPRKLEFPYREIGKKKKKRRFNPDWYDDYAYWLEYSEKEHKAYCLCCYLFRDNIKDSHHGHDAFVVEGFNCWNKTERFVTHVGDRNSFHNRALKDCEDLLKQDQSIPAAWNRQSQTEKNEHLIRLNAAIDVCRYLLHQGQPFRGHDESKDSENKGNYLELMDYTIKQNDVVAKAFKNAPNNNQMLSPKIQRDITECFAKEVLGHVMKEIGNGVFSLLVDECRDVSDKEQMAVVLRYLDKCGLVQEKFVGVVHVEETTASYLKSCIDLLFSQLGLNLEQVRGQGYDGASNMSEDIRGRRFL
uniref:TTF-type domain-containing protein n=1 Tax=Triticum urartu TaxID=4572 RepID=A0A8R7R9K6_TRIUA